MCNHISKGRSSTFVYNPSDTLLFNQGNEHNRANHKSLYQSSRRKSNIQAYKELNRPKKVIKHIEPEITDGSHNCITQKIEILHNTVRVQTEVTEPKKMNLLLLVTLPMVILSSVVTAVLGYLSVASVAVNVSILAIIPSSVLAVVSLCALISGIFYRKYQSAKKTADVQNEMVHHLHQLHGENINYNASVINRKNYMTHNIEPYEINFPKAVSIDLISIPKFNDVDTIRDLMFKLHGRNLEHTDIELYDLTYVQLTYEDLSKEYKIISLYNPHLLYIEPFQREFYNQPKPDVVAMKTLGLC